MARPLTYVAGRTLVSSCPVFDEALGYIARSNAPDEGRARIVRLTTRGRAAYATMHDILRDIEREWIAELGPRPFADLKALLTRVWESPLAR